MMLRHLGMTADELAAYVNEMRTYRGKCLAHLDDVNNMVIPVLDTARAAAKLYHRQVVGHEAGAGDLVGLPMELPDYYRRCFEEAQAIYGRWSLINRDASAPSILITYFIKIEMGRSNAVAEPLIATIKGVG